MISSAWTRAEFPKAWKQGLTILAYKKGFNTDPANFRPITMQPVMSKTLTSIIRNRLYNFVAENKYIKSNVQKGFWDDKSGCYEHTEVLTYVINHVRKKQRNFVVTLIDLKNAFGEVDHKLLAEVLKYHKVPDHIITLITSLYTDYFISVVTDSYLKSPIKVRRGVLQGEDFSPLLFNLIVNTLITTIKKEKLKCMGYVYNGGVQLKHWMQFADDTDIVTALDSDNQLLCNSSLKWSSWAGLIVRVD